MLYNYLYFKAKDDKQMLKIIAENGAEIELNCEQSNNAARGNGYVTSSKVKTLALVDDEKIQKLQELAQKVTPTWRLEQMYREANDTINGSEPSMKNMGTYMKLVNQDIIKEESDVISEAGFIPKDVFKYTAIIARKYYQDEFNKI